VKLCTACIFTVSFSAPAAQRRSQVKWMISVKPEKNACPASALFQCSLIRSDAADAGHKTTQRCRRPPVRRHTCSSGLLRRFLNTQISQCQKYGFTGKFRLPTNNTLIFVGRGGLATYWHLIVGPVGPASGGRPPRQMD